MSSSISLLTLSLLTNLLRMQLLELPLLRREYQKAGWGWTVGLSQEKYLLKSLQEQRLLSGMGMMDNILLKTYSFNVLDLLEFLSLITLPMEQKH